MLSPIHAKRATLAFFNRDDVTFYVDMACELTIGISLRPAIALLAPMLASHAYRPVSALRRLLAIRAGSGPQVA